MYFKLSYVCPKDGDLEKNKLKTLTVQTLEKKIEANRNTLLT